MKYFNSNLVAEYIVNKTLEVNNSKNIFGKARCFQSSFQRLII